MSIFHKKVHYRISTAGTFMVVILSCTGKKSSFHLISKASIEEKAGNVLHHIPFSVQLLRDSLVGIKLDATRFNIYNYYTGKIAGSIELDTNILPKLLKQACKDSIRKYRLMTIQEGKELGVPVLSVENIFYNKPKGGAYLYFTASFSSDTFIMVNGIKEIAIASHPLYYTTTLDEDFRNTNKYTLLRCADMGPAFLFGGLILNDQLIVPNVSLEHISTPGYGMLCTIDLAQDCGSVKSIALPFDKRSAEQRKNHILEKMSFAAIDGQSYYISDGKRIIYCKDALFRDVYNMNDNEHVYNLYYNNSRKQLYINTRFGDHADLKGSKVFALNISDKKLVLVDSNNKIRSVDFINDSTLLSIGEKGKTKAYEFSLYRY